MKKTKLIVSFSMLFMINFISVPVKAETTESDDTPVFHTVQFNESLESIASNYEVSPSQIVEWNDLEDGSVVPGQQLEIETPGFYGRSETINQDVTDMLESYQDYPVYVYVDSLDNDKNASLNGTTFVYGASVPKIVLAAYVLDRVASSDLDWDDTYQYDENVYNDPYSYAWGGSGIMQYEDYRTNTYTLYELTEMTLKHSDNMASNMLLYFVAREDDDAFTEFMFETYQASSYDLQITAKQMSQVMRYIYENEDDTVKEMMNSTDYDDQKLDVVQDETYQKIGGTDQVNHSTAIVEGDHNYVITVLTSFASDETISNIARDVNEVINNQQFRNR